MFRTLMYALAVLFISLSNNALADPTECSAPISVQAYKPDISKLQRQAGYINLWWTSPEAKQLSMEARKAQRESDIADFFSQIEDSRRNAYANARCLVVATKKCASTPGKRHSCPMSFSPPTNMYFIQSTLQPIDDDFDIPPHFNGQNVEFTNKKTGAGSNTDGFQVTAAFKEEYINSAVSKDLEVVHKAVDELFDKTPLTSTSS